MDPGWFVLGAVLAVGITAMVVVIRNQARAAAPPPPPSATAPLIAAELADTRVAEVERRFRCPCGRCGGMELVECSCDTPGGALEVKRVIVELLSAGKSVEETVAAVAERYGALKAAPPPGPPVPSPAPAHPAESAVAAVAARLACPCGRCTDRLLDCDCSHPRGAREVKRFIRERLAADEPADEVAVAVLREFGGAA